MYLFEKSHLRMTVIENELVKKSKKIPYNQTLKQIIRQSDARWCERSGNLVEFPSYSIVGTI